MRLSRPGFPIGQQAGVLSLLKHLLDERIHLRVEDVLLRNFVVKHLVYFKLEGLRVLLDCDGVSS